MTLDPCFHVDPISSVSCVFAFVSVACCHAVLYNCVHLLVCHVYCGYCSAQFSMLWIYWIYLSAFLPTACSLLSTVSVAWASFRLQTALQSIFGPLASRSLFAAGGNEGSVSLYSLIETGPVLRIPPRAGVPVLFFAHQSAPGRFALQHYDIYIGYE
jgi:uncharacterized SAM-binding protein YcdF (DUF218 family)